MTFRITMHSYWFGANRGFVASGCVGRLLVVDVPDVGHMFSGSDPDFTFRFTDILLATTLAINAVDHIASGTCKGRDVSFRVCSSCHWRGSSHSLIQKAVCNRYSVPFHKVCGHYCRFFSTCRDLWVGRQFLLILKCLWSSYFFDDTRWGHLWKPFLRMRTLKGASSGGQCKKAKQDIFEKLNRHSVFGWHCPTLLYNNI